MNHQALSKTAVMLIMGTMFLIPIIFFIQTDHGLKITLTPFHYFIFTSITLSFLIFVLNKKDRIYVDNKNHPERKEDEVFLTNIDVEEFQGSELKTKRLGLQAYNRSGKKIKESEKLFPMFVKIKELNATKKGRILLRKLLPTK